MKVAHLNRIRNREHRARKRFMTTHHLVPKSRGGNGDKKNLLRLWSDKHEAFNTLFGPSSTIDEAIAVLKRLKQIHDL